MSNSIGFNGQVLRADDTTDCDVCENKIPSGSKVATVALDKTWTNICKECLQDFYIKVYGRH